MNVNQPKWPFSLLKWFCKPEYLIDIEGDVKELYERRVESLGKRKAQLLLWKDIFLLFRPGIIRPIVSISLSIISIHMLKHFFLISYRGFLRNRHTFLINLLGLSVGLASVLLIFLWVDDELKVDSFHENDNQLYQAMYHILFGDRIHTWEGTPALLATSLEREMPEVEYSVRLNEQPEGIMRFYEKSKLARGIYASENFFSVFSFPLLEGQPDQVLSGNQNIVLSKELALSFFNSAEEAIGNTIEWFEGETFVVTGIFDNLPVNSSLQFDAVIHFNLIMENDEDTGNWSDGYTNTYLVLKKGTNIKEFNVKIADYLQEKHPFFKSSELFIKKFSDKYLYGSYEEGKLVGGRISYVILFSIVAIIILVMASINFMNLSTAYATIKLKEIGVKKVMGAKRGELMVQFVTESLILSVLSFLLAGILIAYFLPTFNEITHKSLDLHVNIYYILAAGGIILLTGILSGLYPALYLSSFQPINIFKGKQSVTFGEKWTRKGLVIFQFTLSIIFMVSVLVIENQITYTQTKNLGYEREQIIRFTRGDSQQTDAFLQELVSIPGVMSVSNMNGTFMDGGGTQMGYSWRGNNSDEKIIFQSPQIGYNVVETLGMEMLEGRSFSKVYGDNREHIILNESALTLMGLEEPIGKWIGKDVGNGVKEKRQIIGIVKDFHYGSIHQKIEPLILRFRPTGTEILIKLQTGREQAAIEQIDLVYQQFHPEFSFQYTFLDSDYQRLYEAEKRVGVLSHYFCVLAIIISCLGLLGLATFTAERRQKEIGIRKVLGADVTQLVGLLTIDFAKMVLIAICISIPVSYVLAKNWLDEFAYKIELQWWYFAITGLLTILIACVTVASQTLKAASVNPIYALKED